MKYLINLTLVLGLITLLSSCEKIEGCMDENALNYDITAEVNKGCIYCDSSPPEELNAFEDYLIENRFNTELYEDSVLFIRVEHQLQAFEYNQCGTSGCSFRIIATNLTEYTMQSFAFNFEIPIESQFGTYFFQFSSNTVYELSPGEERDITNLFSPQNPQNCLEMVSSGFSFTQIFSGVYID